MDAWNQDLQKQSQDFSSEKLAQARVADANQDQLGQTPDNLAQDKLAIAPSRLVEASTEGLTLAQQRIHR